jgi:hypothetical protein
MRIGFESALIFADTNNDKIPDIFILQLIFPQLQNTSNFFKVRGLMMGESTYWIPLDSVSQDSDFGVIPTQDLQIMKLVSVPYPKK